MTMDGAGGSLEQQIQELSGRMEAGFTRTDGQIRELRQTMEAGFAHTDERFREFEQRMEAGFARMDARFARVDGQFAEIGRDMATLLGMIRKNTEDISTLVTKVDTLTTRADESGARLDRVERMLTVHTEQRTLDIKQLADHESRIRALEKV